MSPFAGRGLAAALIGLAWLTACGQAATVTVPAPTRAAPTAAVAAASVTAPPTAPAATATAAVPAAALVNGQPVPLAFYQTEVQRCQAAQAFSDCPSRALQALIEQAVIEQAAPAEGVSVSAAEVTAEVTRLTQSRGGPAGYAAWLARNFYTAETFSAALQGELVRARLIEHVTASVAATAEQVHARAILVADQATAQSLADQIKSGADFATLALSASLDLSSRVAGGDLGWFPRGGLTAPEVEAAAFSLAPGETSGVIQTALGYEIVQTLERDPARPLSTALRQKLRERSWQTWLQAALTRASIQKTINP